VPAASEAKRQTSRIPLEAALSSGAADKDQTGAPKTIRLKRPDGPSTIKAIPPSVPVESGASEPAKSGLGKTSRLDESVVGADTSATPTRRKTIRVKRPTQAPAAQGISVARSETGQDETAVPSRLQPPVRMEAEAETMGWPIGLCSIAATIVACFVIYVLLAQALGPDGSLTQLSYGAPDFSVSWVGEVQGN